METEEDFLARERAILGDEANLFETSTIKVNDEKVKEEVNIPIETMTFQGKVKTHLIKLIVNSHYFI